MGLDSGREGRVPERKNDTIHGMGYAKGKAAVE